MTDLISYINQTATILINQLPLQSLDTGVSLVEAYISDIGGWIPDSQQTPNGPGHLPNNFTQQQAADAITANEFNAVYDLNFQVSVTLNVQAITKLSDGLSLSTAAISISNQLTDFITASINDAVIPFRVDAVGSQLAILGRSDLGGYTSQSIRQIINSDVIGNNKIVDFKASTLLYAKNTYGLDDTWNVHSLYTEPEQPIVVLIKKYTSNSYATLDTGSTTTYVLTISPQTYAIVSGVILG